GFECDVGTGFTHDDRAHRLTPALVGGTDHRARGDTGHPQNGVLHLRRVHVLPAGDDDVLLAVHQIQQTALVESPDVPGVTPAVAQRRQGRGLIVPVPAE